MVCENAFPQSVKFSLDVPEVKEWYKQSEEYPILKNLVESQSKTISELEKSLALEKRTNELNERELYLQKQIIEVKNMEIQGLNRNFDQMKEIADRAIKLAETVKPKSNWEFQGLLGLAAFVFGFLVAK